MNKQENLKKGYRPLFTKLDVNPTEKLINIAESDDASIGQRIRCWQEIAKYTPQA